ncbi:MAG TPA: ornithine cyclodeaminase family protein [Chthonomonadales bacterium]|nr:ornithine cyclodeaminase family protein [Chthonomonadales bacterium]
MAIFLSEQDVDRLLPMRDAIDALTGAFRRQAAGEVINQPRRRLFMPAGTFHTMVAGDTGAGVFGIKAYTSFSPQTRFLMMLYDASSGDLLAIMEADRLGQIRTGAATGVAARYLAVRGKPLQVGIYGTGKQARTQIEALASACAIGAFHVYGRNREHRERFCSEMAARIAVPISPVDAPEEASRQMDVVVTATTSREPVALGAWLKPGAHVCAIGSNLLMKREIDDKVVERCDLIVVDSVEQSRVEAGDLLQPYERRLFRWEQLVELSQIVAGAHPGRTSSEQISLFKSNGIALEDIAVAQVVYRYALEAGAGTTLPF